uniref:CCHC-type domain-containing protein n=1 Tax=Tanacetum cinerariifolium TaxID=118510 RepID=A0A6L2MUJ6_TANCI|nr:hypothetical protein [Tanacetum cinerariifolium]
MFPVMSLEHPLNYSFIIDDFPLPEQFPTANEDKFPLLIQSDATTEELCAAAKEVIEFRDSYEAPNDDVATGSTTEGTGKKKGRTVALTTEDMQKRKNDDTACAYIASQSSGSQIKFEDITQIDKDDMEEMDIKWNMALLSMRADRFWKKIGKKISIQWTDVVGFDKLKMECFNCHKMGHFTRECRAPRSQDMGRRGNYRQGSKVEEQAPKALMAIDGVGWDWNFMENEEEDHALVADEETPTEFTLMAKTSADNKVFDNSVCSKTCKKNIDSLNRLPEFADDTVTDYSRPSPAIESPSNDVQNRNPSITETEASPSTISSKPFIKFVKAADRPTEDKTDKVKTAKKPAVKTCFNCGHFAHLSYDCGLGVKKGRTCPMNTHESISPIPAIHKTYGPQMRPIRPNVNVAKLKRTLFYKPAHSYRPFQRVSVVKSQFKAPWVPTVNRNFPTVNRKFPTVNRKFPTGNLKVSTADMGKKGNVVKASAQGGCKITGKGTIKTGKLEFKNVYFVKDLKYNLFSVLQICDNKNSVLFTDSECIVLRRDFKLIDDTNMLLKTPRQHNMYFIDLNNIVPHKYLTCLVAKASADEFNTACYVQNNVLINKSQNKTPYELFNGRIPAIGFLKPFGCHVMILNTLDHLGKFKAKGDEGYFIRYFISCKAFREFYKRTKRVEENFHVDFLENKAIKKGTGNNWLFDINSLTNSMNYVPVVVVESSSSNAQDTCKADAPESSGNPNPTAFTTNPLANQLETLTVETSIPTVSSLTPSLDNILTLTNRFEDIIRVTTNSDESNGVEADVSNMETTITASPTPTLRIHKDHLKSQIIGPVDTPVQTKTKSKEVEEQSFIATIHQKTNPNLLQFCLFSCFLSQEEPKKIFDALQDQSWEEGIDYDEVLSPVARIEAIRLFLAYDSFIGFIVYQMDVKSAFLYGIIDEEVYVMQPPGFKDLEFPARVYKVKKAMYGLHQDPRACPTEGGWHFSLSRQGKDGTGKDVDLHLYRSMIGSLMCVTASRPDIVFAVCACARHQVTPKECHLHAVKRNFRYLKGQPKLGLWYPKESPFDLVAYSDSDYGGAT